jgi:uncharacterized membrane protein YesL
MATRRRATLIDAWAVMGRTVADVRDLGVYLIALNIVWFFTSALIIAAPPATAALYAITREYSYGNRVDWLDFFRLIRRYFWVAWRWGLLNLCAAAVYIANLQFYATQPATWSLLGRGFWTVAFIVWIITQMYCFPVLLEQEHPRIRTALRNAFVLVLRHPLFTATYTIVAAVLVLASIAVAYFWIFFTVSLLCYAYNRAVWYLTRLEHGEEPEL